MATSDPEALTGDRMWLKGNDQALTGNEETIKGNRGGGGYVASRGEYVTLKKQWDALKCGGVA